MHQLQHGNAHSLPHRRQSARPAGGSEWCWFVPCHDNQLWIERQVDRHATCNLITVAITLALALALELALALAVGLVLILALALAMRCAFSLEMFFFVFMFSFMLCRVSTTTTTTPSGFYLYQELSPTSSPKPLTCSQHCWSWQDQGGCPCAVLRVLTTLCAGKALVLHRFW